MKEKREKEEKSSKDFVQVEKFLAKIIRRVLRLEKASTGFFFIKRSWAGDRVIAEARNRR